MDFDLHFIFKILDYYHYLLTDPRTYILNFFYF